MLSSARHRAAARHNLIPSRAHYINAPLSPANGSMAPEKIDSRAEELLLINPGHSHPNSAAAPYKRYIMERAQLGSQFCAHQFGYSEIITYEAADELAHLPIYSVIRVKLTFIAGLFMFAFLLICKSLNL